MVDQQSSDSLAPKAARPHSRDGDEVQIRPQDDFYTFTNSEWLSETSIPAAVPWISPYVVNTLAIQSQLETIVLELAAATHSPGSEAARIADLYRSFVDTAQLDARGLAPLHSALARIDRADSTTELFALLPELLIDHADADPDANLPDVTPLALAVRADDRDARQRVVRIVPGGLGLPGRDYYVSAEPRMVALRVAYRDHVAATLSRSGQSAPDEAADRVLALETRLAAALAPEETLRDPAATYHPYSLDQLASAFPGPDWAAFLELTGFVGLQRVIVDQPAYIAVLAELLSQAPAADWQAYLRWQILRRYSGILPEAYRTADFAFYGRKVWGNQEQRTRREQGMLFVQGAMAEPLGRLWVERHSDPRTRAQVRALAEEIRITFGQRIERARWLGEPTRAEAAAKLSQLLIKVGHPDEWTDYSDLVTDPVDAIGNAMRLSRRRWQREVARLEAPADRTRWLDVPQSTTAYYNRSTNELALPAGLLLPPWFDPDAALATNLSAIGAVIGHEMGHAFDDQGAYFDGTGTVRDWWLPEDRRLFDGQAARLVAQYKSFEPLPGLRVNGRLTLSENIGDLTGLSLAHATLVRLRGAALDQAEERRFFVSFCVRWRAKYREPLLRRIVLGDGHPPQAYRCNGPLMNFAPFYRAYGVKPGDGMFIPEQERATIW
ncbi:MAG: M13 family metallopeptidase [Parvularcula sp.]|nr:M13 family metallopeptidase [Parvularcula sp.]